MIDEDKVRRDIKLAINKASFWGYILGVVLGTALGFLLAIEFWC